MTAALQNSYDESVFSDEQRVSRVVEVLKAVAHPIRLRVVAVLRQGECNVSGLATMLDLNQAIVSQQLRILTLAGILEKRRDKQCMIYHLCDPRMGALIKYLEEQFAEEDS